MIITFTPTPDEKHVHHFDAGKLMNTESEIIERKVGKPFQQVVNDLIAGSALARRAVLWVLEKRRTPELSWAAFDFPYGAVEIEFDADEYDALIEGVQSSPELGEDAKAAMVEELLAEKAKAPEVPKAPEPDSD